LVFSGNVIPGRYMISLMTGLPAAEDRRAARVSAVADAATAALSGEGMRI
jgi:hypothetical protein